MCCCRWPWTTKLMPLVSGLQGTLPRTSIQMPARLTHCKGGGTIHPKDRDQGRGSKADLSHREKNYKGTSKVWRARFTWPCGHHQSPSPNQLELFSAGCDVKVITVRWHHHESELCSLSPMHGTAILNSQRESSLWSWMGFLSSRAGARTLLLDCQPGRQYPPEREGPP